MARGESTPKAVVCRIHTARLLLRAWTEADVEPWREVVASNRDHLARWMSWAQAQPESADAIRARLQSIRRDTLAGRTQGFGMFTSSGGELVGAVGSIARIGDGARELGFWLRADRVRQGLMSEAAGALTRIGFEHQRLRVMEIHTDPDNIACLGVARRLGFAQQVMIPNRVLAADGPIRDTVIWKLAAAGYAASWAASQHIEAFDRRGRPVPLAMP